MTSPPPLRIAVVGAGPVGLALALHAARTLPRASVTVFDARAADHDVSADPRTLALSLGSVHLLERLRAWPREAAQPIRVVHVSQQPPSFGGDAAVRIAAAELGLGMLGAVLAYGPLVASLQRAWTADAAAEPARLHTAFGHAVKSLRALAEGVEVDAAIADPFDLAVVAEGGVFAEQAHKALAHDYAQTAWVGVANLAPGAPPGVAFERFTRHGPAALLPLPPAHDGTARAALVWCVERDRDPVRELDQTQRIAVLNSIFPAEAGRITAIAPLKSFPLGLNAERTLVEGRQVRIGNAAQTLHPVAGQGLNLGLRDAFALVQALRFGSNVDAALRRVEWQRVPDRWSTIAATDFLARSFAWQAPGLGAFRGAALAALDAAPPLKRLLARQLMFGWR